MRRGDGGVRRGEEAMGGEGRGWEGGSSGWEGGSRGARCNGAGAAAGVQPGSIGVGWRGQYGGWAVGWAQSCLPWRAGAHQPFQTPYCVCKISCGKSSYRRKKPIDPMATPQRAACVKWGGVRRVA